MTTLRRRALVSALVLGLLGTGAPATAADRLRVVTTVPDLRWLVERVGGEAVEATSLAVGGQDPHFVEPRPSFIRRLHDADLMVLVGMGLELGWLPALTRSARNRQIQPGAPGYLDVSAAIVPLEVPIGTIDRTMGDVHPMGNPHYLVDPINGLRVAGLLRERLARLRPSEAEGFERRYAELEAEILTRLVGPGLVERLGAPALVDRLDREDLVAFLAAPEMREALGGLLGRVAPRAGTRVVEDHRFWAYFCRRFGLVRVATLEPQPGIAPTARHLAEVVRLMQEQQVPVILATPYFSPRHANWVSERTGARVVPMAHQVGSRPGTEDYLEMIEYNVEQLLAGEGA